VESTGVIPPLSEPDRPGPASGSLFNSDLGDLDWPHWLSCPVGLEIYEPGKVWSGWAGGTGKQRGGVNRFGGMALPVFGTGPNYEASAVTFTRFMDL